MLCRGRLAKTDNVETAFSRNIKRLLASEGVDLRPLGPVEQRSPVASPLGRVETQLMSAGCHSLTLRRENVHRHSVSLVADSGSRN